MHHREKIGGVQSKERLFCCSPESVAIQVCLPLALAVLCLLEAMGCARAGDQGGAVREEGKCHTTLSLFRMMASALPYRAVHKIRHSTPQYLGTTRLGIWGFLVFGVFKSELLRKM